MPLVQNSLLLVDVLRCLKFVHHTFGTNPSVNVAQAISGVSKVFVGEMVEKGGHGFAKDVNPRSRLARAPLPIWVSG